MKKNKLAAIAIVAGIVPLAPVAHAADGTINFAGNIVGTTCTINGAASPMAFTVNLPSVQAGVRARKVMLAKFDISILET
ncbi:fimbrial protein [Paraburkholderia terrae]